jgi:hypothetical protein
MTTGSYPEQPYPGESPTDPYPYPGQAAIVQTNAHNMGREERRAQLEQRRAAVAHQLRRLAIELADLDRQLDDIEQAKG